MRTPADDDAHARALAYLNTPAGQADALRYIQEQDAKRVTALESAILRHFPGHKWHDGAMMVSVYVKCECGQTLTVTREMLEEE